MRLSRFERRIIGAIVAVAVVTLGGALWFGQGAVSEAYGVGVNERVLAQLRASLDIYRLYGEAMHDYAERTADAVAYDRRGQVAVDQGDDAALEAFVEGALERYPNVAAIVVYAPDGTERARAAHPERFDRDRYRAPLVLERVSAERVRWEVQLVTEWEPFRAHQRAGELVEVYAQLVGGATYVSSFYTGIYIAFLLSVIIVALAIGIVVSRRVTRRVAVLAAATERVGAGDLTVEVHSDEKDEIAELTRAFNSMVRDIRSSRDRIEYLQRVGAWQDFARRLAHEIKNPLTPIQLAVQQVHRTYSGDDARYRRTVEDAAAIVEEEVATLRRLVGEFSDFARLPVAALEDADLSELVARALRGVDPVGLLGADQAGTSAPRLVLEVDERPTPVQIDPQMLRRALDNLVRNAVQAVAAAAPEGGGRVIVATRLEGTTAVVEVRDDGPGVAVADRDRIFDPYVTTKSDGTGLGLAIVKKVVLEHEGTIECTAAPEGGACFRIRLPLREAA